MSKKLPYYKFFPSEWITGDITMCNLETQGLFVNICNYYWQKDCSMSLANAKQRFSKHIASINTLLEQDIIKVDKDDNIIINFLDEQMNEFVDLSSKRALAGKKGGQAKAKQKLSKAKAKRSNIDKEKIKIKEDKNKDTIVFVVETLNNLSGKNYKSNSTTTVKFINARIKDGFTKDDFKKVIELKCKEWLNTEMDKFLRPETLFGNKFESYLNTQEFTQGSFTDQ